MTGLLFDLFAFEASQGFSGFDRRIVDSDGEVIDSDDAERIEDATAIYTDSDGREVMRKHRAFTDDAYYDCAEYNSRDQYDWLHKRAKMGNLCEHGDLILSVSYPELMSSRAVAPGEYPRDREEFLDDFLRPGTA